MYTLKSKSVKRLSKEEVSRLRNPVTGRLLQLELTIVFSNGKNDIEVSTFISTKDEAKRTIKQNLDRLNEQEELQKEIKNDTFSLEEEKKELSAEEKAKKEKAKKEQELQRLVIKRKLIKEAQGLEAEDAEIGAKLKELN